MGVSSARSLPLPMAKFFESQWKEKVELGEAQIVLTAKATIKQLLRTPHPPSFPPHTPFTQQLQLAAHLRESAKGELTLELPVDVQGGLHVHLCDGLPLLHYLVIVVLVGHHHLQKQPPYISSKTLSYHSWLDQTLSCCCLWGMWHCGCIRLQGCNTQNRTTLHW